MTNKEKVRIAELRYQGLGYKKIAQILNISPNTVMSHCRRNGIKAPETPPADGSICICCGKPLVQVPGRKMKKFCSDSCRNRWWNAHLDIVKRKAIYKFTCPNCKKTFSAYGNANRKYCSHKCYIEDRFGGLH